jgi:hypothetical protein
LPWISWGEAIDREIQWYLCCPWENGYSRFVTTTFMNSDYTRARRDTIPAMQNGMGIISYLKYYHWKKDPDPKVLKVAQAMGDFSDSRYWKVSTLYAFDRMARSASAAAGLRIAGRPPL